MKKTIITIIVLLVLIGGIALITSNRDDSTPELEVKSSSSLISDKLSYDFGEIDIFGGKVETEFVLTNDGPDDVIILAGTTSCGCTEGVIDGVDFGMHEAMPRTVTIEAGQSKSLTAIYDPLAHGPDATGSVVRQLFLKTNSEVTPEIELRVLAKVTRNQNIQ